MIPVCSFGIVYYDDNPFGFPCGQTMLPKVLKLIVKAPICFPPGFLSKGKENATSFLPVGFPSRIKENSTSCFLLDFPSKIKENPTIFFHQVSQVE